MDEVFKSGNYEVFATGNIYEFKCIANPSNTIKQRIANQVVKSIISEDYYHYLLKDIILKFMIIRELTNVDLSSLEDDEYNLESVEEFINGNSLYDAIEDIIGVGTINDIRLAIEFGVEYKTGIHRNPLNESLATFINGINNAVSALSETELKEFVNRVNKINGSITSDQITEAHTNSTKGVETYKEPTDKQGV